MTTKILEFKVFCLEVFKQRHGLTGKQVQALFEKYKVLDYIGSFYDVLHTTGENYIIDDIEKFIETRKGEN